MEALALSPLKKTVGEKDNSFLNLANAQHDWTAVYIKEEPLCPDENQNNYAADPLKRVKPEFEVLVNELDRGLSMPASTMVPDFPAAGRLSGSNSELREVMAEARATLSQSDGEAFLSSLCSEFPSYSGTLAYDTPYDGSQYVDNKITSGYGVENSQYSSFTPTGQQPSSSPDTNLSDSSTEQPSVSPDTYPSISPISQLFSSQATISSVSPDTRASISPDNNSPSSPNEYAWRGPSSSVSPQSSGSASSYSALSPDSEFIIPDLFLNSTNQEVGASMSQLGPEPQSQSLDHYIHPEMSSVTIKQEISNYYTSPSMFEVSSGLNNNLPHPSGEMHSPSGRIKRLDAKKEFSRIVKKGQSCNTGRKKPRGSSVSPRPTDETFLPPITSLFRRQSGPVTNTGSFPPFSHHSHSYLINPTPYTGPNGNTSSQPFSQTNNAIFTGDSPVQTYTQLHPQSHQPSSPLLMHQSTASTYTTNATSTAFSASVQPTVYSYQMPSENASAFSPSLAQFATVNPTASMAGAPLVISQESGNHAMQLVSENRMSNAFPKNGKGNGNNVAASTKNGTSSTSGQKGKATRRTSRVFNSLLKVSCPICFAAFSSTGHLKRHMESHGAERRFRCHKCDCAYSRQDNLRNHLKTAHGIEYVKTRHGKTGGGGQGRRGPPPAPLSY